MSEPKTKTIKLPPKGYTPRQKDLEEEFDMPGLSQGELREAFMQPMEFEKQE